MLHVTVTFALGKSPRFYALCQQAGYRGDTAPEQLAGDRGTQFMFDMNCSEAEELLRLLVAAHDEGNSYFKLSNGESTQAAIAALSAK